MKNIMCLFGNHVYSQASAEVAKMPAAEQEPLREKMKTEKAIERIKAFRDYLCAGNPIWDVGECKEAFDIAIAAMEQRGLPVADVPDINDGDMISRQAVIKLILSGRVGDDSRFECPAECNGMLEWAADEVAWMPSPEPWKGEEDG